jgi:hypothetical protein
VLLILVRAVLVRPSRESRKKSISPPSSYCWPLKLLYGGYALLRIIFECVAFCTLKKAPCKAAMMLYSLLSTGMMRCQHCCLTNPCKDIKQRLIDIDWDMSSQGSSAPIDEPPRHPTLNQHRAAKKRTHSALTKPQSMIGPIQQYHPYSSSHSSQRII